MNTQFNAKITAVLILIAFITQSFAVYAGGYYITDKDGKVISEISERNIIVGPTEKTIIFSDYSERKVFDITWDADEQTLIVKGDHVHLKIYSSGKIEKWSTFGDHESEQYPIFIEPIVPITPRQKSDKKE
jgi:hypothetical protein